MFKFGSRKDVNIEYKCTIRLLDDTEVLQCDIKWGQKGQTLLDFVCGALNLIEKDYFGLRYVDTHNQRHWLDPTRCVMKQVKGMNPIVFCFRVKFYPPEPHRLREEITRYQVFLQLRRDLLHGRLYCSQNEAALLAAFIIQSELGDYDPEEHSPNYVSDFKLLLKQTPRLEEKVTEIHQSQLRGQVPAMAEINFLRKACLLDTYGVDPHPVKDHKGNQMYLGINHNGILTFQGSRKTHHFKWNDIQKINYEGKMFIVHLLFNEKKHLIGFKCPSHGACHHLWKCAVEQRYFFTMNSSSEVPNITTGGGLFSRGCKFRYSGRVEKEVVEDTKLIKRDQPHFNRMLTRPPSFRKQADGGSPPSSPKKLPKALCNDVVHANHSTSNVYNAIVPGSKNSDVPTTTENDMSTVPGLRTLDEEDAEAADMNSRATFDEMSSTDDHTIDGSVGTISGNAVIHRVNQGSDTEGESMYSDEETPDVPPVTQNTTVQSPAACIEDFLPPHVKLPKRRFPIPSSYPLPPHVNIVRVFVLASLFVLLLLSCLLIVVMESDSSLFSDIRKVPEMIVLRREYYEPVKDYVVSNVNFLFKR